jgi:hypothetical protein
MHINLDDDESFDADFISVPESEYLCRVEEVRWRVTRGGAERWSIRLVVDDGEHEGKQAAWDSIVWTARGKTRARLILKAFGLPHKGKIWISTDSLVGRRAYVTVRPATYESVDSGAIVKRNEVKFDGYRPVE